MGWLESWPPARNYDDDCGVDWWWWWLWLKDDVACNDDNDGLSDDENNEKSYDVERT